MVGVYLVELLDVSWIGVKLFCVLLLPAFFWFWPWFNEVSDVISRHIVESRTGKLTQRIYQTMTGSEGRVVVQEMSLDEASIGDRMLGVQTWLPSTAEKAVQCLPGNGSSHVVHASDSSSFISLSSSQELLSRNGSFSRSPSSLSERFTKPPSLSRSSTQGFQNSKSISSDMIVTSAAANVDLNCVSNDEIVQMLLKGDIAQHALEKRLDDSTRAVEVRRKFFAKQNNISFDSIPHENYNYNDVTGACCEVVVGYVPIPLGIVGPMKIDGEVLQVPMATTEGTLVASTNRGCKAMTLCGGATTNVVDDGITRAPCVQMPSAREAAEVKAWLDDPQNKEKIKQTFNSTTRFGGLKSIKVALAGRLMYIRFKCFSGDAMGMNMVSKGTDKVLELLSGQFPEMEVVSLSGNYCTDKKPAAINWIEGRGKSVTAEAVISGAVVRKVLKTTVDKLVDLNMKKNLIGSAMAGSIGGFNAHAANLVTAVFLATGQDPAQVVESANCITLLEPCNKGLDLRISVTMPSIEVGTIGGGTGLGPQAACLEMLGLKGSGAVPGENSKKLARVVATTVMCGELSLLSALSVGHLVKAHMKYNRSTTSLNA